jgi:D-aminoacyl-tRNA deacylase
MIVTIQRVSEASVKINEEIYAKINKGLLLLIGIAHSDTKEDAEWLTNKIANLRIFDDENGIMNLSIKDIGGDILTISQFTLHAKTKKGNRPSYIEAAKPPLSTNLYKYFINSLEKHLEKKTFHGIFGEYMKVSLCNDGPVTIIIDTDNKK